MEHQYYEAADFFLTRFSLDSLKQFEISPESLFEHYKNSPRFQEAIAIASPSLHQAIAKNLSNNKIEINHFRSLLKYFLRMRSRATPFGLFSAIGWGEFGYKTDCHFSIASLQKNVAPDTELLQSVIDDVHKELAYVSKLNVRINSHLIKKAGRVYLKPTLGKKDSIGTISIKSSTVSDLIFNLTRRPILYNELEDRLCKAFDEHPKEKVSTYLWEIFQKGYLVSELSASLMQVNSLNHLCSLLKRIKYPCEPLESLAHSIESYQKCELGNDKNQLEESVDKVSKLKEVKNPLQVNVYRTLASFKLSNQVKNVVEETVSLLYLLSEDETDSFNSYKARFIDKYGTYRLVPLLELIDPNLGIGFPQEQTTIRKRDELISWKKSAFTSLKGKVLEIDSIPKIVKSSDLLKKAPLSFELFFELLAFSEKDLESNQFTLLVNPIVASSQAGGTFGRFLPYCELSHKERLFQFLRREEQLFPQVQFVEATFLPDSTRSTNVICLENTREYQLQMHYHDPAVHLIELEDVYVGSSINRLYLYSKKLGKEIHIVSNSAINPSLAPPLLQFMLQLSKSTFSTFSPFFWKDAENESFLPRVKFKNVILSPARWKVNLSQLELTENFTTSDLEKRLSQYLNSIDIPDQVLLTEYDNRLKIDWKDPEQFQLLVQNLKSKRQIILYESLVEESNSIVNSELGRHIAEFVVPCIKKETYKIDDLLRTYPTCKQIRKADRIKITGSDWLYLKLFLPRDNEESFLINHLYPFIQQTLKSEFFKKWFCVRYQEDRYHLRLRFQGDQEKLLGIFLPSFSAQAIRWISTGLMDEFTLHPYEREVERYGGPESFELVEDLFFADSENAIFVLENTVSFGLPLSIIAALGILNLLRVFYSSTKEQLAFFAAYSLNKNLLSGVREHTSKAVKTAHFLFHEEETTEFLQLNHLKGLFNYIVQKADSLNRTLVDNTEWNSKQSIVQSILHMHCNRIFGPDIESESKALVTAHYLLEKILHQITMKEVVCQQ